MFLFSLENSQKSSLQILSRTHLKCHFTITLSKGLTYCFVQHVFLKRDNQQLISFGAYVLRYVHSFIHSFIHKMGLSLIHEVINQNVVG